MPSQSLRFTFLSTTTLVTAALVGGCDKDSPGSAPPAPTSEADAPAPEPEPVPQADAELQAKAGLEVSGVVHFRQTEAGVAVEATISGLAPGTHGFHIHQTGDCSAEDFSSAGGHFNPAEVSHGGPEAAEHHIGDLGNIEADTEGHAAVSTVVAEASLDPGDDLSILGRAVVIHEGADDLMSQPSGAAGARVACAVIDAR